MLILQKSCSLNEVIPCLWSEGRGRIAQVFEQDKFPRLFFYPFLNQLLVGMQSQELCGFLLGPWFS